ncbi:MAG: alkaline phosphatase family protein [Thermodesulfobacteriota bacterium]
MKLKLKQFQLRFLFLFFLATAPTASEAAAAEPLRNVLVVSIDALHPDALGPEASPAIAGMMRQGAFTLNGQSTDPPLTLLAHTSMFTGLAPEENGKTDNGWQPGMPTVAKPTLFDAAKSRDFQTGYFYSKMKLGYLVNDAVDVHRLSKEFAVDDAFPFFQTPGRHFVFLHISGLDYVGPASGWLSAAYLEELGSIDETLGPLFASIMEAGNYLIVVTSDHAGHDRIHGSDHPEDARLPLVLASDRLDLKAFQDIDYSVLDLKPMLTKFLGVDGSPPEWRPGKKLSMRSGR